MSEMFHSEFGLRFFIFLCFAVICLVAYVLYVVPKKYDTSIYVITYVYRDGTKETIKYDNSNIQEAIIKMQDSSKILYTEVKPY